MSIVLQSTGGGSVTINEPVTASNFTVTLPAATGTAVVTGTTPTLNGITFPATQVPSADANTLDDYEEGTWTPVDGSGAGLSFTINTTSTYTKIGNFVTAYCSVTYPSTSNGSHATIGGLPFVSAASGFGGGFNKYSTYPATIYGACGPGNTIIFAYTNGGAAISNLGMSTARIDYVISYRSV